MLISLDNAVLTVQQNFSFATHYLDHVRIDFTTAVGEEESSGDDGGFNPMSAQTGVLPAPSVWLKADGANNTVLKGIKRILKAKQTENLRTVHIS